MITTSSTSTAKSGKKMNGFVSGMMATPPKMYEQSVGNSMPYGLQLMMMMIIIIFCLHKLGTEARACAHYTIHILALLCLNNCLPPLFCNYFVLTTIHSHNIRIS